MRCRGSVKGGNRGGAAAKKDPPNGRVTPPFRSQGRPQKNRKPGFTEAFFTAAQVQTQPVSAN